MSRRSRAVAQDSQPATQNLPRKLLMEQESEEASGILGFHREVGALVLAFMAHMFGVEPRVRLP